ncbi:membrane hypothetical protein [Candidatus Sulfotelmatomonas gaucii]|uniref:Uncharacterized protein n=1 Tax=Candidatus Sulfuritelmatomonas gaucii TaxID=2043161 RepID=A0A2N9M3Q1_9BACT|nr:membrane hypothetical protein [Candidatus Sulfotelmatomonas gaucii]
MAATASIIIEVDDAGATQAFQRINTEASNLGNNMRPIAAQSDQAFGSIAVGARQSREQVALLSEEMGIGIPRAMRGVIAGMPGISAAINSAFTGLAIVGFIGIAESAGEAVAKFIDHLLGWSEMAKRTMDAETALNQQIRDTKDQTEKLQEAYKLIGLQGLPLFSEKQKEANDALDAAKKKVDELTASQAKLFKQSQETQTVTTTSGGGFDYFGGITTTAALPTDEAMKAKAQLDDVGRELDLANAKVTLFGQQVKNTGKELEDAFSKEKADAIHEVGVQAQEALTKLQAMTKTAVGTGSAEQTIDANKRALEEQIADLLTYSGNEESVRQAAATAVNAIEKKASDDRIKLLTDEADKKLKAISDGYEAEDKLAQEQAVKMRKMETDTETEERNAAIAMAPPWEQANAKIVEDYRQRTLKIQEMLNDGEITEEQAARRMTAAWETEFAQMRDELANKMETLFDDITSGHIGQAFLTMFKQMVFQMLATWIMGMQGMSAAASQTMTGSGGGILGSILGALGMGGMGGISGGAGGDGIPTLSLGDLNSLGVTSSMSSLSSSGAAALIPGLGLSAGGGSSAGGIGMALPAGAAAGAGLFGGGGLAGLLTSGAYKQLALTGGIALLASSFGKGGVGGILGSAAGGALIGSIIPGIGSIVGALIGGLVGLFSSIFGEHSGDKARKQVIEPMEAQIKVIQDSYDVFQTDYNTGVSELEQLRSDSIAALKKIGGKQLSGNTTKTNADIDAAELHLKTTEAERNRRAQIDFGPAQFSAGGFVHPSLAGGAPEWFAGTAIHFGAGGAVPAILHGGEFVVNSSATQRLGPGNLARANAGGSMGGDLHVHIDAMDVKSFRNWLRSGGMRAIAQELARANSEGGF